MRGIMAVLGIASGTLDVIGIVVGFSTSIGQGFAALFVPPYGFYLGLMALFR